MDLICIFYRCRYWILQYVVNIQQLIHSIRSCNKAYNRCDQYTECGADDPDTVFQDAGGGYLFFDTHGAAQCQAEYRPRNRRGDNRSFSFLYHYKKYKNVPSGIC